MLERLEVKHILEKYCWLNIAGKHLLEQNHACIEHSEICKNVWDEWNVSEQQ